MGMAILGPSPPYEYPINQLLYVNGERSVREGHVAEQEPDDDGQQNVQDGQVADQDQSRGDKDVLADVVDERIQEHT